MKNSKKYVVWAMVALWCALLCQSAFAEGIVGRWSGKIYASKFGFTLSRIARATFSSDGKYTLKAGDSASAGTYVLEGKRIHLTTGGGRQETLTWSLRGNTLTMKGKMDVGGYNGVSTRMVVKWQGAKVVKVACPKVDFGTASAITVKCNTLTERVRMLDEAGNELAFSDAPNADGAFVLSYKLPGEKTKARLQAALKGEDGSWEWGPVKSATLTTRPIAASTRILSVIADAARAPVGAPITVLVIANDKTTRVRVVGAETVESGEYTMQGENRVFTVSYAQATPKKKQKLTAYSGDEHGFKTKGKSVRVTFTESGGNEKPSS